MELAQLGTSFVSDHSLHGIKGFVVPFVAYLTDAHEGTSDGSDLEHRSQVVVVVGEIQGLLVKVGDRPTITLEKLLPLRLPGDSSREYPGQSSTEHT